MSGPSNACLLLPRHMLLGKFRGAILFIHRVFKPMLPQNTASCFFAGYWRPHGGLALRGESRETHLLVCSICGLPYPSLGMK